MRTRTRADRIVTNILREIASECGLPGLNRVVTNRLTKGSRFQLTSRDYSHADRSGLPLYEQVCRVNGPTVYWTTVYPGNVHAKKRRALAGWVVENAKIVRR